MKLFGKSFRFFFHEIDPTRPKVIINKGDKPTSIRQIRYTRWSLNITMNKCRMSSCPIKGSKSDP